MLLLALGLGGVLGTLARYGLGNWLQPPGSAMPWGTLAVNVLGSFLLGAVIRVAELGALSPELRLFLTVGVCGAFTTFSTLSYETVVLLQGGLWARAAAYALGSVALGLAGVLAGLATAPFLLRALR